MFESDQFIKFRIPTHSDEWFKFRTVGIEGYAGGIGASEIGKITGKDEYRPVKQELYYQKIGLEPVERVDNIAMFHGRKLEPYIKNIWQCWDNSEEGYIEIYENWEKNGKQDKDLIRVALNTDFYLVNVNFAQLFASLDYAMHESSVNIYTGEVLGQNCPLECKTIGMWAAKKWEQGIPPKYIDQVHSQMIVTETNYSEIAVLEDGRKFRVYPVNMDTVLREQILQATEEFWYGRVLPGRKLAAMLPEAKNSAERGDILKEISNLEPPPDQSEAYRAYISTKYQKIKEYTFGEEKHLSHAKLLKRISLLIKELGEHETKLKNQWYDFFNQHGVSEVRFGKPHGNLSITKDSRDSLRLYNNVQADIENETRELKLLLQL